MKKTYEAMSYKVKIFNGELLRQNPERIALCDTIKQAKQAITKYLDETGENIGKVSIVTRTYNQYDQIESANEKFYYEWNSK